MSDPVRISTDPADLDRDWTFAALSERAYWALGRDREVFERSLAGSLVYIALAGDPDAPARQVGFARVVTDRATFAWICDVFVDESVRGMGVGKALVAAIVGDPRLQALKRMLLATNDAHGLYAQFGFGPLTEPGKLMVRADPRAR